MERYQNLSGDSNIVAYIISPGSIELRFVDGWVHGYDEISSGATNIRTMQELARLGQGLNTFIDRVVKDNYAFRRRSRGPVPGATL